MKSKTLEDMEIHGFPEQMNGVLIDINELKPLIVKWIKEDRNKINIVNEKSLTVNELIETWMKRLNITDEDLMSNEEINDREHGEVGNN